MTGQVIMKSSEILNNLDLMIGEPVCELNYTEPYELLIAVMLSAQSTDKRVNIVTKELFSKYSLRDLVDIDILELESIIKSVGTYHRKALYIKNIANSLIKDYDGEVPNNRDYLESLDGIGRKSTNVILAEIFKVPAIAVDTHVERVSKRLETVNNSDDVLKIEKKLMKLFPKDSWCRLHLQLVLFGRYICTSKKPKCSECKFQCKKSQV